MSRMDSKVPFTSPAVAMLLSNDLLPPGCHGGFAQGAVAGGRSACGCAPRFGRFTVWLHIGQWNKQPSFRAVSAGGPIYCRFQELDSLEPTKTFSSGAVYATTSQAIQLASLEFQTFQHETIAPIAPSAPIAPIGPIHLPTVSNCIQLRAPVARIDVEQFSFEGIGPCAQASLSQAEEIGRWHQGRLIQDSWECYPKTHLFR